MSDSVAVRAIAAVPRRPLATGFGVAGAGLVVAAVLGVLVPWSVLIALLCYLLAAVLISAYWQGSRFGAANTVTLARVVGGCWVAALTAEAALAGLPDTNRLLMIGLAGVCVALDGVDGWVARTRGERSDFGARFDVETDALLLLCLSVAAPVLGVVGWWALLLSGLRYGYLCASWVVPALRVPLRPRFAARVICVVVELSLIAALAVDLVWPGWPASAILVLALLCLGWSFARDIVWQVQRYVGSQPVPI